jgi:hypothetical protein
MSARDKLRLMAPTYNFTPEEWQYRLADLTTAATVCGLFAKVQFLPGLLSETLVITDDLIRERAKRWMREVAMARGITVTLHEPKVVREADYTPMPAARKAAISATRKAQCAPQTVKVDKRSSEQGKQRMRAAAKARWVRQKQDSAGYKHGTIDAYNNRKCRCDACKKASSEYYYMTKVRQELQSYLPPDQTKKWAGCAKMPRSLAFGEGTLDEVLSEIIP